jgi:hypothetical protein
MRREKVSLQLYPTYPVLGNRDKDIKAAHPKPSDFQAAEDLILSENFTLINRGRVALYEVPKKPEIASPVDKLKTNHSDIKSSAKLSNETLSHNPNSSQPVSSKPKSSNPDSSEPQSSNPGSSEPKKNEPPQPKFIAYIQFTPSEELTEEEKEDLNFIANYLDNNRKYVSTVSSPRKILRGHMWSIGWRKSQTEDLSIRPRLPRILMVI